ncbi:hypothetical protein GCM10027275_11580 [Rhabdobacter roseus]|uniref:Putative DNA-binding transcriptional regulator YafY n=1 Tax=Rhabdobacter roseus TaxID=1655419 RepID=A0A840TSU1_9BACT|nr:YafY family protein [Rhabdobacter roseus]MBB5283070.1 putative DNA-binding transcriptional regulator YafY [Rhabdobacter roseus]
MNRFDRITAILIQLQSRKVVKAQDIAARFDISLRTVYRDIRSLEEAGVPLIGEAGVGYSLVDGYRLPPVMFTREEAISFLTAEKLVEKFTDTATQKRFESALYKIKSVLKSTEKDLLENMEGHIQVFRQSTAFHAASDDTLEVLLKCISEKKIARISYKAFNTTDTTERAIEPIGIFHENNYWYTIGFCHLRHDYRQFRSDRILKISCTDRTFENKHASLKEYLDALPPKENLERVVIRVEPELARYIQNQKYYYGFVSEQTIGPWMEMTFLSDSLPAFARWYLMFADRSRIVSPEALRGHVKGVLSAALSSLE